MNILKRNKLAAGMILILIIALVLSPMVSFAVDPDQSTATGSAGQIGDYVDVNDDGKIIDGSATNSALTEKESVDQMTWVKETKTIEATDTEDLFKINLKVTTNETREETTTTVAKPVDVVIMMDVSGSMDANNVSTDLTRWQSARANMISFIDKFLGPGSVAGNRVAIGTFSGGKTYKDGKSYNGDMYAYNDHCTTVCAWTNNASTAKASIDGKERSALKVAYQGDGTNMEAGFIATDQILTKAAFSGSADYSTNDKVIIYVGDGAATYNYDKDGYTVGTGNSTTDNNAPAAITKLLEVKEKYKGSNVKLYTMGIGTEYTTASDFEPVLTHGWNSPSINGVDKFFLARNNIEIEQAFQEIKDTITHNVEVWNVTDPMSDWVKFEGFDGKGSEVNADGKATILDNNINWDLGSTTKNSDGFYEYNLSYYVTLDKTVEGFVEGKYYPTNKITSLNYAFKKDGVLGAASKLDFKIPTVKGKLPKAGTLSVEKKVTVENDYLYDKNQEFTFGIKMGKETSYMKGFRYSTNGGIAITPDDGIIRLKAGEKAVIDYAGFKIGEEVTVEELLIPAHYSCDDPDKVITVSEENQTATITNVYDNSFVREGVVTAEKTSDPRDGSTVEPGETIEYCVTVKNNMNTGAAVSVTDPIPEKTTYVEGSATDGGYLESGIVKWDNVELASGESKPLKFKVTVDTDFVVTNDITINNIAYFTYEGVDGKTVDDKTNEVIHNVVPTPISSFSVEKTNNPGNGEYVGEDGVIEYFITVTNTGDLDISNLKIKDTVPTNTTFKEFTGGIDGQVAGSELIWDIGSLTKEKGSVTVSFKVTVNDGIEKGTEITNIAYATDAEDPGDNDWTPSEPVTNLTPGVEGEIVTPPNDPGTKGDDPGNVKGESANPTAAQKVLGEEAKTGDMASSMPYLIIMVLVTIAVFGLTMFGMSRKEN